MKSSKAEHNSVDSLVLTVIKLAFTALAAIRLIFSDQLLCQMNCFTVFDKYPTHLSLFECFRLHSSIALPFKDN